MRRIIAVEETVRYVHEICVEVEDESDIERALDSVHPRARTLDEWTDAIGQITPIVWVNEDYDGEPDGMEYFDDYEVDAE